MADAFCSTIVARFSLIAPTSSMEAAISLIDEAVSSAAAARSSVLPEIDFTEADICVNDADVCSTDTVTLSASRVTPRIDAAISAIDVETFSTDPVIWRAVSVTLWIDADVSCSAEAFCVIAVATWAVPADTCSIDAAISAIPDTSSSVAAATDSALPAVSVSEALIPLRLALASVSDRSCSSAPSDTSPATTAIWFADAVTCCAWASTSPGSNAPCRPWPLPLPLVVRFCVAITSLPIRLRGQNRLCRVQQRPEIEDHDEPAVNRRDAADVACAHRGQAFAWRLNRRRWQRQEFAAGIDQQSDTASPGLDHEQPGPQITIGPFESEPRAHVDGRDDLPAREHDAVDERGRVGYTRDLLHHLDVCHLLTGQPVRRPGDAEQNV